VVNAFSFVMGLRNCTSNSASLDVVRAIGSGFNQVQNIGKPICLKCFYILKL
jgi:hypothetical protein